MVWAVYCCKELDIVEYSEAAAKRHAKSLSKHLGFEACDIKIKTYANEADAPAELKGR